MAVLLNQHSTKKFFLSNNSFRDPKTIGDVTLWKNSQWTTAVFISGCVTPVWHHHSDIYVGFLYVLVAGERKSQTSTHPHIKMAQSDYGSWVFCNSPKTLPPPPLPIKPFSLQSYSKKDTGLFEVAERSQAGRLRKVGLPFHSPSLACTAIKEMWKQGMSH